MVDIHCHIVPEVDDGAWSMETSLEMARLAVASGVKRIVATPHFQGVSDALEELPYIIRQFRKLEQAVREEELPLELLPGMEVLCVSKTLELARRRQLPTLGSSNYVLTEFYFDASRDFIDSALQGLQLCGYQPVVAHPERYGAVQRDPELVGGWFQRGIVIQVNKGSVLGAFGLRAEEAAMRMLTRGTVHIIASDAHSPRHRTTDFGSVRAWSLENLGREYTRILLEDNPGRITMGLPMCPTRRREY